MHNSLIDRRVSVLGCIQCIRTRYVFVLSFAHATSRTAGMAVRSIYRKKCTKLVLWASRYALSVLDQVQNSFSRTSWGSNALKTRLNIFGLFGTGAKCHLSSTSLILVACLGAIGELRLQL